MVPCLRIGLLSSHFSHISDTSLLWFSSIMIRVIPEALGCLVRSASTLDKSEQQRARPPKENGE